ncbi:hypothetical protein X975_26152, partial [Stegodyphus mimosarum]
MNFHLRKQKRLHMKFISNYFHKLMISFAQCNADMMALFYSNIETLCLKGV